MIARRQPLKPGKPLARKKHLRARSTLKPGAELRRSPLASVSEKRAAKLAAAGKPVTATKRPRSTGPDRLTVEATWARDEGRCAWCSGPITGERGWDWSVQHRRPRRAGGDPRPDTNSPANLVLLHGHALSRCHGQVESRRTAALDAGFLLHDGDQPAGCPIEHAVHGWVLLTDDAGWAAAECPSEVAA